MMKNAFISSEKLISFLRYLNFCPDFSGHAGVTNWEINHCNTRIAQYLKR